MPDHQTLRCLGLRLNGVARKDFDKEKYEVGKIGEDDPDDNDEDDVKVLKCFLESIVKTNATREELVQNCTTVQRKNSRVFLTETIVTGEDCATVAVLQ